MQLIAVIPILASGEVPTVLLIFIAERNLTALNKSKENGPFDICPIAVEEAQRLFTGKCLCAMIKAKVNNFFPM